MNAEELRTLGMHLIHDLRTPLAAIKAGASGIQDFLPVLIDAYQKACQAKLLDDSIQPRHLELLTQTLDHIEASANAANQHMTVFMEKLRDFSTSTV